jgi:hypothetical protein
MTDETSPGPCPRCGEPGYLAHIDLRNAVKHEACRYCAERWEVQIARQEEETSARPTLSQLLERAAETRRRG